MRRQTEARRGTRLAASLGCHRFRHQQVPGDCSHCRGKPGTVGPSLVPGLPILPVRAQLPLFRLRLVHEDRRSRLPTQGDRIFPSISTADTRRLRDPPYLSFGCRRTHLQHRLLLRPLFLLEVGSTRSGPHSSRESHHHFGAVPHRLLLLLGLHRGSLRTAGVACALLDANSSLGTSRGLRRLGGGHPEHGFRLGRALPHRVLGIRSKPPSPAAGSHGAFSGCY
jgi:hypothetical protein